jgi:DNA replication protein
MPDKQLLSAHSKTGSVFLPDSFFTQVMPKIQNLVELKVVLYVAHMILRKQPPGAHRCEGSVTYSELKAEISQLLPDLGQEALRQALDSAVEHGALSRSTSKVDEVLEDVYSLTIESGETPAANIFTLYEQNIGIMTPMIAEELKEAERIYPAQWIEDAFREAVALNKRSWRYIARILERWASEGKDSGEHKRDIEKGGPDKYVKGKYGHLVKR